MRRGWAAGSQRPLGRTQWASERVVVASESTTGYVAGIRSERRGLGRRSRFCGSYCAAERLPSRLSGISLKHIAATSTKKNKTWLHGQIVYVNKVGTFGLSPASC